MAESNEKAPKSRVGRFIKRSDPLATVLSISDFCLAEICETPVAYPDNEKGSIIHHALHFASDEDLGIRVAGDILKNLGPEQSRPILRPMDFTEDWKRQKQRMSSRSGKMDEDEEFELEMELLNKNRDEFEDDDEDDEFSASEGHDEQGDDGKKNTGILKIQRENLDVASKAIQEAQEDPEDQEMEASVPEPNIEVEEKTFVPMKAVVGLNMDNPELQAIKTYQEQLIDREKIIEEAKSVGYQEGFKVGEEKAALQVRQTMRALTEELGRVLGELEGLKKTVLHNAEENFQVLSQALVESVLRREMEINQGAFAAVIERAIQEAVQEDQFKIHVHPETFETFSKFADEKLRTRLISNKAIPQGDFRIESNMSVVDGNITQLVRDLLDQADLSLFHQTKNKNDKAS